MDKKAQGKEKASSVHAVYLRGKMGRIPDETEKSTVDIYSIRYMV